MSTGVKSTSEQLLQILEEAHNHYISGAEVAGRLGISKTSVWKAVNKLRNEGHRIEAVTHRGYRLSRKSDALTETGIIGFLSEASQDFLRIDVFGSVNSTNDICLEKASAGEAGGYAAVADMQTGGRGRRGRSFFSPSDTGLYISLLLRPEACTSDKALRFTTAAAVSVCEAIEKVSQASKPEIKWVNDIYMRGRKVCGILTEASFNIEDGTLDYAVIGIGINVYTPEGGFPAEITGIAGSVFPPEEDSEHNRSERNRLAAEVLNGLVRHCVLSDESCISEYRKRCMVPGRKIDVITHSGTKRAQALGLDDECRLLVRFDDGSEEYLSRDQHKGLKMKNNNDHKDNSINASGVTQDSCRISAQSTARMSTSHMQDLTLIPLCASLMAVCSWISVPAAVPFTMQTFAVFLTVGLLGGRRGSMAVALYLALGAVGLPVFAGFAGGIGYMMGPTGGYIAGFLLSAFVMWSCEALFGKSMPVLIASMAAGLIVCYAFGTAWFMAVYTANTGEIGLAAALGMCVLPYVIPDLIKILLAAAACRRLRPVLAFTREQGSGKPA